MRAVYFASVLLAIASCNSSESSDQPVPSHHSTNGTMPLRMRNCPSAVPSAVTVATPTAEGVDVTVTAPGGPARTEIVARSRVQAALGNGLTAFPEHSGMRGGPGTIGHCPIIHANTTVSYEPIARGVTIHVVAHDHDQVAQLQRTTEQRVRALNFPSS